MQQLVKSAKVQTHRQYIRYNINLNIINQVRSARQRCRQSVEPSGLFAQFVQCISNSLEEETVIDGIIGSAAVISIPWIFPIDVYAIEVILMLQL